MDFESPDVEKDFPGLYASEAAGKGQDRENDYTDEEKVSKKELLIGKLKDKKEKKDKGYVAFEGESSEEDADDCKGKGKKSKAPFKFPGKEKREKSLKSKSKDDSSRSKKDSHKDVSQSKKGTEKEKGIKEQKKKESKVKIGKKKKKLDNVAENPIFGVPLSVAVERNPSHDGIELPAIVRECIDYIEEHGLMCEGIYRLSGVKSKVQQLRAAYNRQESVCLSEHEPQVIATLLKQFLRELPEPVLTNELSAKFEVAAAIKDQAKCIEAVQKLIDQLPVSNRLLLSWVFVHMSNIISNENHNKMNLQNVFIVLGPSMQISHKVLNALFTHGGVFFKDVQLKRYVKKIHPDSSRQSLELPETPAAIEEELSHQEQVLSEIHTQLNAGLRDPQKEEQLWEVQRVVTQLKRKLRVLKQVKKPPVESSTKDSIEYIDTRLQQPITMQKGEAVTSTQATCASSASVPVEGDKRTSDSSAVISERVQSTATEAVPVDVKAALKNADVERAVLVKEDDVVGSGEMHATGDLKLEPPAKDDENGDVTDVAGAANDTEKEDTAQLAPIEQQKEKERLFPPAKQEETDPELQHLRCEQEVLIYQQEELLSLGDELRRKIAAEKSEIERLRSEITEYQKLAKYKQYSVDSGEHSSSGSESSENEQEEDLKKTLARLMKENEALSLQISNVSQRILEQREACVDIKVRMRALQNEAKLFRA
ncbi:ralA-binding protein 1-like isoform X1 [Ornithodoros turicata]|uniref:ralA-binding protein 1-like isoform X1 n=1 Tax=Ornithodoros turicata TaxID=34597 RepID=UPI003138EC6C